MARVLIALLIVLAVLYLFSGARRDASSRDASPRPPGSGRMTRSDALQVLGLGEGASKEEILVAHRQLIRKVHPDNPGGSTYLAAQINRARDVLLG